MQRTVIFAILLTWAPLAMAQEGGSSGASAGPGGTLMLGADPYGRAPYPLTSRGARIAFAADAANEIELTYVDARITVLLAEFRFREAVLRHRIWVDSFVHCGYGIGVRDVIADYDVFVAGAAEKIAEHHQAITGNAHLGIEIRPFSHLAIGSDLFGVSMPIKWLKDDDGFPVQAEDFEEDPKDAYVSSGFKLSYHVLRTYVAVRF